MPREKFSTLTEPMFYILLCLQDECCGMDIMEMVSRISSGRVTVGPGTLYNLLEQFLKNGMIQETKVEGRRRSYILTTKGFDTLQAEYNRICTLASDYCRLIQKEDFS